MKDPNRDDLQEYSNELMDRIDDCKKRGAINDMSAFAYQLVQTIIKLNLQLDELEDKLRNKF